MPESAKTSPVAEALEATRAWVRDAVIGLNLCPFAKAPVVKGQVRYAVCETEDPRQLLVALSDEMDRLAAADPAETDTTLLIHPNVLLDFDDFNDFLFAAETMLVERGHEGVLQIASFHPHYRFAGTAADDLGNATNRSPCPILHLLREASVERAVDAFPQAEAIYENNIATLERLGAAGWEALAAGWRTGSRR
ncbi:MAG: DUF1415 domain-containing protein [Pseudomonadota bacterium]|nr:DUF1415 domain-containing protein [Pseudomonadota bacterium]